MREELIFLLNEAGELEHSLSCSYLFAAYSLKDGLDEGLTPEQLPRVLHWKRELTGVAIEEMFHLAVVTNLLTAVGAPPHFDRPNFPHDCTYYLPEYQIELRPFSTETLDHFLAIEQPDGNNTPALLDPERLQRVMGELENEIGPDPHHFDSQGDVYGAVIACLDDLVRRLGESNVFIGVIPNSAIRSFMTSGGWEAITGLESAKRNFARVVEQGEGAHVDATDSHYARFRAIKDEYLAMKSDDPAFEPMRPVVMNPFVRTPPEGSGPVNLISDEFTVQVSDLFNEAYGLMLQTLGRLFTSFEESEEEAQTLIDSAIELMAGVVNPLGSLLCRLPAGAPHDGMTGGPSFVLRTVHALADKRAAWLILRERSQELGNYAKLLAGRGDEAKALRAIGDRILGISEAMAVGVKDSGHRQAGPEHVQEVSDGEAAIILDTAQAKPTAPSLPESGPAAPTRARVQVRKNGPYVVQGDVPVYEMAPVHTFNGEPVDWHTLREIPVSPGAVRLCRCGGSGNKPFCDGTHARAGFDGAETSDQRPYLERASHSVHDPHDLADDKPLCFKAGFCGTRTTNVWKLLEQSDDPAALEKMRNMVWNCPSGRLVLLDQGNAVERELAQSIAILPGGPIWVRGGIPIEGSDGVEWEVRNRATLCRCGLSSHKPFCDGTHITAHFDER